MENKLVKQFNISVTVDKPVVVGQDDITGRRQLISITGGTLEGYAEGQVSDWRGNVLPYGVDSQIIRPDGRCELSARYGVKLEDGRSFYIENNGIRTVPEAYVEKVVRGEFIDPELYYFCTTPTFEIYDQSLSWLKRRMFICVATRLPDRVILDYCTIE